MDKREKKDMKVKDMKVKDELLEKVVGGADVGEGEPSDDEMMAFGIVVGKDENTGGNIKGSPGGNNVYKG